MTLAEYAGGDGVSFDRDTAGATVPLIFDADSLIAWAADRGEQVTRDEFETMVSRAGRVDGPWLMMALYANSLLPPDVLRLVGSVWSDAEYPDRAFEPRTLWLWLFDAAGFTIDGEPAERPAEPIRLFRGSVPERRLDWSWTADRAVAERFAAGGIRGREPGKVWTAMVEPWRLLCRNDDRDESEYVVNTKGLKVAEDD